METKSISFNELKKTARTSGFFYLLLLFLGPPALMLIPEQIVAAGDPTATLANLRDHESLFRWCMAAELGIVLVELVLPLLLFRLFAPVNQTLSGIGAVSRLGMALLQAVNLGIHFGILALAKSAADFSPDFAMDQVSALFELYDGMGMIWQGLFGLHCAVLGWLIWKSGYIPRWMGATMGLAAVGYLAVCVGNILAPEGAPIYEGIAVVGAMAGEVPLLIWLLWKGVRSPDQSAA